MGLQINEMYCLLFQTRIDKRKEEILSMLIINMCQVPKTGSGTW